MPGLGLVAFALTAVFFGSLMKRRQEGQEIGLDPMGFWIIKDLISIGPRLILAGLRQVRCCGELGELNAPACAEALAYLARHDHAVTADDLLRHCPQLRWERLRAQLSLLDGVLFLDGSRVTLMDPFRLRLRWMMGWDPGAAREREPARPRPEPPPQAAPVTEPEQLSPYEILGLSPLASLVEIKRAYRKRMKECHPDLFAGMDQQAQTLAERWAKALNHAYATLNPRHRGPTLTSTSQR